jgi:hypothetical protein
MADEKETHKGPRSQSFPFLLRLGKWVLVGVLAMIVPVVVAAEASFKSLIEEWFNTCSVAVDQSDVFLNKGGASPYILVELFVLGKVPNKASIIFASNEEILSSLEYKHDVTDNNRLFHPGLDTPIPLKNPVKNIKFDISPFSSKYLYKFKLDITPGGMKKIKDNQAEIGSFIEFNSADGGICRVSKYTIFDGLVGASSWARFGILAFFIIFVTAVVNILRWMSR